MIYLVRHAPTACNNNDIFMGTLDWSIEFPVEQEKVTVLQTEIKRLNPIAFFSSPLKRCLESAELVVPNQELIIDKRLMEKDLGEWQGKNKADIKKQFPTFFNKDGSMDISKSPPNGESFEDFCARVKSFVDETRMNYYNNNIVVFTHGGFIATAYYLYYNELSSFIGTHRFKHLGIYPLNCSKHN